MTRIAESLGSKMPEIGQLIVSEVGTPINLSMIVQVGLALTTFASMAELTEQLAWEETYL